MPNPCRCAVRASSRSRRSPCNFSNKWLSLWTRVRNFPSGEDHETQQNTHRRRAPFGRRPRLRLTGSNVKSADREKGCVDLPLIASKDARVRYTLRADTLFVVERRIEEEDAATWLKWYRIDTSRCDWLPVP